MEYKIRIAKHLLKCYFKHIFIILAASKRVKHTVLMITPSILIRNRVNRTRPKCFVFLFTFCFYVYFPGSYESRYNVLNR